MKHPLKDISTNSYKFMIDAHPKACATWWWLEGLNITRCKLFGGDGSVWPGSSLPWEPEGKVKAGIFIF
jgi:hypothetical protein